MKVIAIDATSPHLAAVIALGRENKRTLGMLADEAFIDYAIYPNILIAIDSAGVVLGYLLYRVLKSRKATIVHLCVASHARRKGCGVALIEHLKSITKHLRGIGLRCRRDLPGYDFWPRVDFAALRDTPGRSKEATPLTTFWFDHGHRDLLVPDASEALDVVIDTNVFIDLVNGRDTDSLGLQADWLQDSIRLCITPELFNDINQNPDETERHDHRIAAQSFAQLNAPSAELDKADRILSPLFTGPLSRQDESDLRHLIRAVAAGADVFVTRDEALLDLSDNVYNACGLSIVRPAGLIGRIDQLQGEHDYQRSQVAGTNRIFEQRIDSVGDALIAAIRHNDETAWQLRADINRLLADPQKVSCHAFTDNADEVLAFYAVESDDRFNRVLFFRICSHRFKGTLARSILTALANRAANDGKAGLLVRGPQLTADLEAACSDLGFLRLQQGWLKVVLTGIHPPKILSERIASLGLIDPAVEQLQKRLLDPVDSVAAAELEHIVWPAKIADVDMPCFIVPIRAEFAQHLFEERLARQTLFGADTDLALNPESVYYRSARPGILECPGRILWYVSSKGKFDGKMHIRACSRITDVLLGKPKDLFKRFRRLGVYEWQDVFATAKGNLDADIMAIRFHDTELLNPVPWATFQGILKSHEIHTQLESPARIPGPVFNAIYTLALDSTAVR